jgi:hypothetical protein
MTTGGVPVEVAFETVKSLNPQMPYRTAGELADAIKDLKADTPPSGAMDMSSMWGRDGWRDKNRYYANDF